MLYFIYILFVAAFVSFYPLYIFNRLFQDNKLGYVNLYDTASIQEYFNIIIKHITTNNNNNERLMKAMGGEIIITKTELVYRKGYNQGIQDGFQDGELSTIISTIKNLYQKNYSIEFICETLDYDIDIVTNICSIIDSHNDISNEELYMYYTKK